MEEAMDVSNTSALERIARVLAGLELSLNGDGQGTSVGRQVDDSWRRHLDSAVAVLSTLREPDQRMAAAGDVAIWARMVRAALGEDAPSRATEQKSWAEEGEIYQKPLG
jgi:hypothetical protein